MVVVNLCVSIDPRDVLYSIIIFFVCDVATQSRTSVETSNHWGPRGSPRRVNTPQIRDSQGSDTLTPKVHSVHRVCNMYHTGMHQISRQYLIFCWIFILSTDLFNLSYILSNSRFLFFLLFFICSNMSLRVI